MVRKTTSLKIEEDLWDEAKIYCIKAKIQLSELVEEAIKDRIRKPKGKGGKK